MGEGEQEAGEQDFAEFRAMCEDMHVYTKERLLGIGKILFFSKFLASKHKRKHYMTSFQAVK